MPTPSVVATLPFPTDRAAKSTRSDSYDGEPAILALADAAPIATPFFPERPGADALLDEACDLARRLGCQVRRRLLGGAGGGYRWVRGRMQVVLDVEADAEARLAIVADALRGDARLAFSEMSSDLAAYLQPRRAA